MLWLFTTKVRCARGEHGEIFDSNGRRESPQNIAPVIDFNDQRMHSHGSIQAVAVL